MPSWLPGTNSGTGPFMNMDTSALRNTDQLTSDPSAFKEMGFELTRRQRLTGFVGCLIGGFVLSILGSIMLFIGQSALFAVLYSVGIIVSLIGTGFLVGFMTQLKGMFKPVRVVATIILLGSLAMVFISAFLINSDILALVFVIVLYLAYIWYSLSYIPYARTFVKNIFSKFM